MAFEIDVDWITSNFNGQPCIITLNYPLIISVVIIILGSPETCLRKLKNYKCRTYSFYVLQV